MLYSIVSEKSATYYQESFYGLLKCMVSATHGDAKTQIILIVFINGAREQTIPLVVQNQYQDQILDYNDQM